MDEQGCDSNKGRRKKVGHVDTQHDGLKHNYDTTDGDNNPFHVTLCATSQGLGDTPIPLYIGHSNPSCKSTTGTARVTRKYLQNLCVLDDNGEYKNVAGGMGVFVTRSGSMTKDRFPAFCRHFVQHLPEGQGKGGSPVILVFDGHASRWNYAGLKYLLDNNVFCLCLPGHTSIWSQPQDGGPNASFNPFLRTGPHL